MSGAIDRDRRLHAIPVDPCPADYTPAMNPRFSGARLRVVPMVLAGALALALPASVLAHAELESATPADGTVLTEPPDEIVLTFTEDLDASKSSLTLHTAGGEQLAAGTIDPADAAAMRIDDLPNLAPGTYEIRWTSAGSDAHLERGTLSFELTAPTPSPTIAPTPEPSAGPTPSASPSAVLSSPPSPAPSTADPTATSGTDVLLPIVAALILVAVLGWVLLRSRSRGGGAA